MLQAHADLKLSVEDHTDNLGNPAAGQDMRSLSRLFTPRAVTPCLAALLLVVIAAGWSRGTGTVSATTTGGSVDQGGGSCPLTSAQQVNSSKAWLKMMPVFRHPRCLNCHGGIPDPLASPVPAKHSGVVDMDSTDRQATCEECHMPGWRIPGHKWTQKADLEICSDMKVLFTATQFVDHIVRDGGGTPFIEMAFEGLRGLNQGAGRSAVEDDLKQPFVAKPPPGTHAQLIQQARDWVKAQGGSFVGDQDCGCTIPETGEVYLLEIQRNDPRGFQGILVTDSVTMRIRIEDTTVTVFAITNFPSTAAPKKLTFPTSTVSWIPDPVGLMNIVSATGSILLDYPTDNARQLHVDFTHSGTRSPQFVQIFPPHGLIKEIRQNFGGEGPDGNPGSISFDLVPGKKVYETVPASRLVVSKLTLLVPAKK